MINHANTKLCWCALYYLGGGGCCAALCRGEPRVLHGKGRDADHDPCVCNTSSTIKRADLCGVAIFSAPSRDRCDNYVGGELRCDPPTGMRGRYLLPGLLRVFSEFLYRNHAVRELTRFFI